MDTSRRSGRARVHIRSLIEAAKPGDQLPAEADLAKQIGVSRVTVRDALNQLWFEGAITRRWGVGTFVADPRSALSASSKFRSIYVDSSGFESLRDQISNAGHVAEVTTATIELTPAPSWAGKESDFRDEVWRVQRVISIDGLPSVLLNDFLPHRLGPLELNPEPLREGSLSIASFFRQLGVRMVKQEAVLDAVIAEDGVAVPLQVDPGTPLIHATQRAVSESGDTITCSDIYYRNGVFSHFLVRTITD